MTRQICILGNSHVGALHLATQGSDTAFPASEFAFDSFGSPRASIQNVKIEGARMTPTRGDVKGSFATTSGGQTSVELDRYDLIVIAFRNTPFWIRPYLARRKLIPLSKPVVQAIHTAFLADWSIKLAREIAEAVPDTPVAFLGRPLNSEDDHVAKDLLADLAGDQKDALIERKETLVARIDEVVSQTIVADNLRFVRPPEHLLEQHGLFTLRKFTEGAVKFRRAMKDMLDAQDTQHMNRDYGTEILKHVIETYLPDSNKSVTPLT